MTNPMKVILESTLTPEICALYGRRVYLNSRLTIPGPPQEVRRSWKERLFSLPWHPLQKVSYLQTQIPSRDIFALGDYALVMHPEMFKEIKKELDPEYVWSNQS